MGVKALARAPRPCSQRESDAVAVQGRHTVRAPGRANEIRGTHSANDSTMTWKIRRTTRSASLEPPIVPHPVNSPPEGRGECLFVDILMASRIVVLTDPTSG